jgi:ketosteroid isomerase-like protein
MSENRTLLDAAHAYLQAVSRQVVGDELAAFYDPAIIQEEFPNRLYPTGARRSLADLLAGAERGRLLMRAQSWTPLQAMASGETVALEVEWAGTLAIDVGTLKAGDTMKARFAVFLEFRDGRILRQRNYDCFEPW